MRAVENPLIEEEGPQELSVEAHAKRLKELVAQLPEETPGPGPGRPLGSHGRNIRTAMTHDSIIDYLLANPTKTNRDVAAAFNYSTVGIGIIIRSDSFQAAYQARKEKFVDPIILRKVTERLDDLAHASMDILERKLETSDNAGFALKVLDTTQRAKGYGAPAPTALQASFVVNLPGPAASTAEWTNKFGPRTAEVIEPRIDDLPSE